MTVREVKKGQVVCDWWEGNKARRESYYVEQLVSAAKKMTDLEVARWIAFTLQNAAREKGVSPAPDTLDKLLDAVLDDGSKPMNPT